MEFDRIKIGKVRYYDVLNGIGEIVDTNYSYLFTIDSLENKKVENGDLVKFRAEIVNDTKRAFFIEKIDNNYELKDRLIKGKLLNKE